MFQSNLNLIQSDNLNIFLETVWSPLGKKKACSLREFLLPCVSPQSMRERVCSSNLLAVRRVFPAVVATTYWSLAQSPLWTQLLNMLQDAPAAELAWYLGLDF